MKIKFKHKAKITTDNIYDSIFENSRFDFEDYVYDVELANKLNEALILLVNFKEQAEDSGLIVYI